MKKLCTIALRLPHGAFALARTALAIGTAIGSHAMASAATSAAAALPADAALPL